MVEVSVELPDFAPGAVWLVGAGPGDPGLLTLLAVHALAHADVVVYDALVDPRILALARPGARQVHAGKRGGRRAEAVSSRASRSASRSKRR